MFKHVPYASAKFFYQIATNGFHYDPEKIVRADTHQSDDIGSQKKGKFDYLDDCEDLY